MQIPLSRPSITGVEEEAVLMALRSGWLTHGAPNERFERELAAYLGVKHAVSVNSCASALFATLVAADITGEVLVPSFTWCATANAVVAAGATPVWVDVEPETYGLDPVDLSRKIGPRCQAIIAVHYAGHPCDISAIQAIAARHHLLLIEDAAETLGGTWHGRPAGSFGVGCFSFFPTKNITTGEGGMMTTNDPHLATAVRLLSRHGVGGGPTAEDVGRWPWHKEALVAGHNFRMPAMLAALGSAQFARLEGMNRQRRERAAQLSRALAPLAGYLRLPREKPGCLHVYQMYVIEVADPAWRDSVVAGVRRRGVEASVHFYPPVHLQALYRQRAYRGHDSLPVTEATARRVVTLPMYPDITVDEVEYIADAVAGSLRDVLCATAPRIAELVQS